MCVRVRVRVRVCACACVCVLLVHWFRAGPSKRFPVVVVTDILKDALGSYLQEEKYDAELCRQMTKTISEVPFYSLKFKDNTLLIPDQEIQE